MSDFRRGFLKACSTVVLLYTTNQKKAWRHVLVLFLTCFLLSSSLNLLLLLCVRALKLDFSLVSVLTFAGCCLVLTGALFFSKNVRCFTFLLLVSCGMKQGRNILLITGAGLVGCWSVNNAFQNLHTISQSILCNLRKKAEFLQKSPIDNYVRMIRWYRDQLKTLSDFAVVQFDADINVESRLDRTEDLNKKLREAEELVRNKTAEFQATYELVMTIMQRSLPVLGLLLLLFSTAFFLRNFLLNKKYNNGFITRRFERYDQRVRAEGKPGVLPLNEQEAHRFITIPCARPRRVELMPMALYFVPVIMHVTSWTFFMLLDLLLYWITTIIKKILIKLEPFQIPLKISVHGSTSILSFIPLDDMNKYNDFSFSVSLFEDGCLPQTDLVLTESLLPLLSIIGTLIVLGLLSAKLMEFKLLVSESFHAEVAEERVQHLHAKILRRRAGQNAENLERTRFQFLIKDVRFWFPIVDFCRSSSYRTQNISS